MKNSISFFILILLKFTAYTQQIPQFTQYMYNTIAINPAFAGAKKVFDINILNRNQWVGISGAPNTQTLSINSPINQSNVGVGLSIINDKIGYEESLFVYGDVSYKLNLDYKKKNYLTFGLKGGFERYGFDSDLENSILFEDDDFLNTINQKWLINFGIGFHLKIDEFSLGIASPKLFKYQALKRRNLFINGSYLHTINDNIKFKPAFIIKYIDGAPLSVDLTSLFLINEKFWLGAFIRLEDSVGVITNIKVLKNISVGYSYDYVTSKNTAFTSGSHEIMINYKIDLTKNGCNCYSL